MVYPLLNPEAMIDLLAYQTVTIKNLKDLEASKKKVLYFPLIKYSRESSASPSAIGSPIAPFGFRLGQMHHDAVVV